MTVTPQTINEAISITAHEGDLHEITIHKSGRDSVNHLFDYSIQVHENAPEGVVPHFFIAIKDSSDLPIKHVMARVRTDWRKLTHPTRVVYIANSPNFIAVVLRLSNTLLSSHQVMAYPVGEEEKAMAWLMQE